MRQYNVEVSVIGVEAESDAEAVKKINAGLKKSGLDFEVQRDSLDFDDDTDESKTIDGAVNKLLEGKIK
jgi:hypothetical protein